MSCEKHKEIVEKYDGSLEDLANDLGDLHYGALTQFLYMLSKKIEADGEKDNEGGRPKLAAALQYTSMSLFESALRMEKAWKISKPFMSEVKPLTFKTNWRYDADSDEIKILNQQFFDEARKLYVDIDNLTVDEFKDRWNKMWAIRVHIMKVSNDWRVVDLFGLQDKAHKLFGNWNKDRWLGGDDGSVGKELLMGVSEIEEKINVIQQAVNDNYFTLEKALEIYGLSMDEYLLNIK